MHKNLYFIPIIAGALEQPDTKAALSEAFELIHSMGKEAQYHNGYQQFLRFMESVDNSLWEEAPEQVASQLLQAMERPFPCDILVECDDHIVGTCSFKDATAQTIAGIKPGFHHLRFETGLLLWQGAVADEDVLWSRAFSEKPLKMAADTEEVKRQPTRTIDLPESGLILRFYAGIETGFMEIEMTTSEAGE